MTNFPAYSQISAITNAKQAVVTMTANHDFTVGELVSFRVGPAFGMHQINNKRGKVLAKTNDTITIDIDTSTWGTFSLDNLDTEGTTPPVCVPSASSFIPNVDIQRTNLLDTFDVRP